VAKAVGNGATIAKTDVQRYACRYKWRLSGDPTKLEKTE
jgi:hypothetical protein